MSPVKFLDPELVTPHILDSLPPLYSTETIPAKQKVAVAKFFGGGRGTWYAVEGEAICRTCGHNPQAHKTASPGCAWKLDVRFFGYVVSPQSPDCDEWGYFMLSELQSVRFPPFGTPMERDEWWSPGPIPDLGRSW